MHPKIQSQIAEAIGIAALRSKDPDGRIIGLHIPTRMLESMAEELEKSLQLFNLTFTTGLSIECS